MLANGDREIADVGTCDCNVLVIDDNAYDRSVLGELARSAVETDAVVCARSLDEALSVVGRVKPLLVILDDHLGPALRARTSILHLRNAGCHALICVATSFHQHSNAGPLLQNAGVLYFDKDKIGDDWMAEVIYLARHTRGFWKHGPADG